MCQISIETPFERTKNIEVNEVVQQGTLWGPFLCSIVIGKINNTDKKVFTPYEKLRLEPMIFVNDICGANDADQVATLIRNCKKMEKRKKMTFNNKKRRSRDEVTEDPVRKKKTKEKNDKITANIKKGKIDFCEEYKYLGETINTKGDYSKSIEQKEKKTKSVTSAIKRMVEKSGSLYNKVA